MAAKLRTLQQNKILHGLLTKAGIANDKETKEQMVMSFTNGRTESTASMYEDECQAMINQLARITGSSSLAGTSYRPPVDPKADRMRKRIIAMGHDLGWQKYSDRAQKLVIDMPRLNAWCVEFGKFKKPLDAHTVTELPQLVSQFELMYNDQFKRTYGQKS